MLVEALVIALTGLAVLFGSSHAARLQVPHRHGLNGWAYVLMVAAVLGLAAIRRRPLVALGVTVVATVTYLSFNFPYGPILITVAVATFAVAVRLPLRLSAPAAAAALVVAVVPALRDLLTATGGMGSPSAAWSGWLVVPWTIGTVVRVTREAGAQARADEIRQAGYEERLRVAREVHDIVGHGLAVINMQASVALHVLDRRPEQAAAALEAVKQTSKSALDELRSTLAVFRQRDDGEPARGPVPGLSQVDALAASTRDAGLPVEVTRVGDPVALPAVTDHAAFRIVQESLTNVLRHAMATRAEVSLDYRTGGVTITVRDDGAPAKPPPGRSPGHGIAGMRERAVAVGGTFSAGPRPGGGFEVSAHLPAAPADGTPADPPAAAAMPDGPDRPAPRPEKADSRSMSSEEVP
jgi:signal transduction histidine kinase